MEDFLNFEDNGVLEEKKPIFISGVYRSGTTFLTALVGNHPNISAAASTVKYLRFCLPNFDLNNPKALDDLLVETAKRIEKRWDLWLDTASIMKKLRYERLSHALVYDEIMETLLVREKKGATRWAEKINAQWRDIPKFLEMFPNGQVIHIFRDPRNVCSSYKKMTYEPWPAFLDAALNCKAAMIDVVNYQNHYGTDRVHIIRAEDLAVSLGSELKKIFNFLGEPFDEKNINLDEYLDVYGEDWRNNTSYDVKEENYTKALQRWDTTLTSEELFLVELFCQPEMSRFGYEGCGQSLVTLDGNEIAKIFSDEWLSERVRGYLFRGMPEQGYRTDPYLTEMNIVFGD